MTNALLVGAGLGIAPHLGALRVAGITTVDVVSASSRNVDRVRAAFPQGRTYATLPDAIGTGGTGAGSDADGRGFAVVATPPNMHLQQISELTAAGYDVLVEKPIARNYVECLAAVSAAESCGRRLFVCLQHRYKESAIAAADIVARGEIGDVVGASVTLPWYRPQSYYDEPGRGTLERDGGGVLITQAIHVLDLALSLLGPVRAVASFTQTHSHQMPTEDLVGAVFQHESGAVSTLLATTATQPGTPESISVMGTGGQLRLSGSGLYLRTPADGPLAERCLLTPAPISTGSDPSDMVPWYRSLYADILPAITSGEPTRVDARRVLHTHEVMDAVYASARTGETIALPSTVSQIGGLTGILGSDPEVRAGHWGSGQG